jgi:phosphoribosylanthranilate isomerase
MPGLWVKICGMTSTGGIAAAAAAGADAVGFVFYEASPRRLTVADAQALQPDVPPGMARVAVFLHPSQALVDAVIEALRPDYVQIDLEDLAMLALPAGQQVLPVLRSGLIGSEPIFPPGAKIGINGSELIIPTEAKLGSGPNCPPRVLFESGRSGQGERADWTAARALAGRCELVLAGGLDAGNVADAVRRVRPFGVDVSSGVEHSRGVKDPARILGFIRAARAASAALASQETSA